jgi:hypothetical protein
LYFHISAFEHNCPSDYSIKGVNEFNGLGHCYPASGIYAMVRLLHYKPGKEQAYLIIHDIDNFTIVLIPLMVGYNLKKKYGNISSLNLNKTSKSTTTWYKLAAWKKELQLSYCNSLIFSILSVGPAAPIQSG